MRQRSLALLICCSTVLAPAADAARKPQPATLGDLAKRSAPIDRAATANADAAQAAESYQAFLQIEGADAALRAQALRRLGDLRLADAEAAIARDGDETEVARGLARQAIDAYRQLLSEQPSFAAADAVLYQLARALEHVDDAPGAAATLDRLVSQYPGSSYFAEAQFRRGEGFFSEQRYADAERAYAAVLAGGRGTEFFQQAQYKYAWALFKQNQDDPSSAAFLALLDTLLVEDGAPRPAEQLSRAEQELADDALRALAITFAANEGPATLQAALDAHGPTPYESRLYAALGDLFVEKERFQDGAEAYRAFARRQPMHPQAPLLLLRATEAYGKGGFASLVLDGKRQLAEEYGPGSAYWNAHPEGLDSAGAGGAQARPPDPAPPPYPPAEKGRDILLEEIEVIAAGLLRKKAGSPVLKLPRDARIVHLCGQPFHGNDAEHVRHPGPGRGVDLGGLPEQPRNILSGYGLVQNPQPGNRASLIQGERGKVEGRTAVFRQPEKMQKGGFERIGVRALDHLAVKVFAQLVGVVLFYRNHWDCPIFPIITESFQPGSWLSHPRFRAIRSE